MNNVILKGSKNGIKLVLNNDASFDTLKIEIEDTFKKSGEFFKDALMALEFEGRNITDDEAMEIVEIISNNSSIRIACIVNNDPGADTNYKNLVEKATSSSNEVQKENDDAKNTAQFYKGTVRSGQVLESSKSLIILGDVNPGGKVVAKGSVIVLGALKGIVYAGGDDDEHAFVIALDMAPMQIKICDIIARAPDSPLKKKNKTDPKIAFIEDENIYIEPLGRDVLNDISI